MANVHGGVVVYQGDDLVIEGALHAADGSPLNLSGTPTITWRVQAPDGSVAFDYSVGNGITVVDTAAGLINIVVPKAATTGLAPGVYTDQCRAGVSGLTEMQWTGTLDVRKAI